MFRSIRPGEKSTVRPIRRLSAIIAPDEDGHVCSSGFVVLNPQTIAPEVLLTYLRLPIVCELMDLHTSASLYPAISERDLLKLPIPRIPAETAAAITEKIRAAHTARAEAHALLEKAKRAVEVAIEQGEDAALALLDKQNSDMKNDMINGGVLLLGSLEWETAVNADVKAQGATREAWRGRLGGRSPVTGLPLRYARISGETPQQVIQRAGKGAKGASNGLGRRGQYTMCLTLAAPPVGQALFRPFVSNHTEKDVSRYAAEVSELADAEGIKNAAGQAHHFAIKDSRVWGLVAIWINPGSVHRAALHDWWRAHYQFPDDMLSGGSFQGIADEHGFITLDWPNESLGDVDFCLCTPTVPNDPQWSASRVARAAIDAHSIDARHGTYFRRTCENQIFTAEDAEILSALDALHAPPAIYPNNAGERRRP